MVESVVTDSYAGRDVLNAPAIKVAISERSRQREDTEEISAWLVRHFFRYVIGNLDVPEPQLVQIRNVKQAEELIRPKVLAPWAQQRLKEKNNSNKLWWIAPEGEEVLALEARLIEFLLSRKGTALEGKLSKINCFQALAIQAREHAIFESKQAIGWREHSPEAVAIVYQGQQGNFVELLGDRPDLRAEMAYESQMMRHCLGQFSDKNKLSGGYGEYYAESCEAGKMRLFSYRTGNSQPHITISAMVEADSQLMIEQIKGKQNKPPIARYADELLAFLNALKVVGETPADAINMGIVRTQQGWRAIENVEQESEQLDIIKTHPILFSKMPNPSPLIQWLIAAEQPSLLQGIVLAPALEKALKAST